MRRRYLVLVFAATFAGIFALRSHGASKRLTSPGSSARNARIAAGRGAAHGLVSQAHYHLSFEQHITMSGRPPSSLRAEGEWITTSRADGRTEVRFVPDTLDGPVGELPRAADLDAAAQLVSEQGVLNAIGFPDRMPAPARKLLTGLATTFQYTGQLGADWTIGEEDLTGRYDAVYRWSDDEIQRSRTRYTALRAQDGLSAVSAGGVTPTEKTRFRVDDDGVVSAVVELDVTFAVGGVAPIQLVLRGSLERESIEQVEAPGGELFAAAPISGYVNFEGARRNADRSLVAGATVADLLAEVKRVAALAGRDGSNARAQALARLAALIRLDPEAAEEVADQVRQHPEALAEARVLVGALGSARVAAGTDALAGLMADELPDAARGAVVGALSFANPVTPASLHALSEGIEKPHGNQAALGLGTQSRKMRETDPASADAATQLLLSHQASAGTVGERRLFLEALGNSGATQALPVLRAAMTGDNSQLATAAAFSLRYVPGADVDALLAQSIEQSVERPEVALAAIRAAAYRDPAKWRPLLVAAQGQYPGHDGIQGEIRAILRRWG